MLKKTLKEKKDLVSFIKKMTKTFNSFKNAHAEIIERGKPSSETTKAAFDGLHSHTELAL